MVLFLCWLPWVAARERADIVVRGGTVVTVDGARRVLENGAVAVSGDRIAAVGATADIEARFDSARTIDARGHIVLPGLVNAHGHAPMVLFRGIADDLALSEWLEKYIFPAEARHVTAGFVEVGTLLACLEMIRSGTTTYADMYYFEEQVAEATARAGLRGVLGETIIQFPVPDARTPRDALAYTEKFIRRWKGHPLVVPAVAPHAPYTNSEQTLRDCRALADRFGVPMMMHVSETRDEVNRMRERYDATSTGWLDSIGVLGPSVVFHHGVWLTDGDIAILKRRGVSVTHNPESNMKLASGTAPVLRMLSLGLAVGLGTDGAPSNNDLDMFEAMDFAGKLHKLAALDPTALPALRLVEMATMGGARALKMEKEIGSLEVGKKADFIMVDMNQPHMVPLYDVYSHLAYVVNGSDVRTSIVNGRIVMLDRRVLTLDEEEIKERAGKIQAGIAASLKK
jgi:5-methylthioadenosine/S-adenosylhomocysteine deaminase